MDTVIDSCGCVFCDMGLKPIRHGDEIVHAVVPKDMPWVPCLRRPDTPAAEQGGGDEAAHWHEAYIHEHDKRTEDMKALRAAEARIAELIDDIRDEIDANVDGLPTDFILKVRAILSGAGEPATSIAAETGLAEGAEGGNPLAVPTTISPSNPSIIIAGIRQFGLAPDGSDLRDLEAAFARLKPAPAHSSAVGEAKWTEERLRDEAKRRGWYVREGTSVPQVDGSWRYPFSVTAESRELVEMLNAALASLATPQTD